MKILFETGKIRIIQENDEWTAFNDFSIFSDMGDSNRRESSYYYIEFENVDRLYNFLGWLIFEAGHDDRLNATTYVGFRKRLIKVIIDNREFLDKCSVNH